MGYTFTEIEYLSDAVEHVLPLSAAGFAEVARVYNKRIEELAETTGQRFACRTGPSLSGKWMRLLKAKPTGAGGLSAMQVRQRAIRAKIRERASLLSQGDLDSGSLSGDEVSTEKTMAQQCQPGPANAEDDEDQRIVDQLGVLTEKTKGIAAVAASNLEAAMTPDFEAMFSAKHKRRLSTSPTDSGGRGSTHVSPTSSKVSPDLLLLLDKQEAQRQLRREEEERRREQRREEERLRREEEERRREQRREEDRRKDELRWNQMQMQMQQQQQQFMMVMAKLIGGQVQKPPESD